MEAINLMSDAELKAHQANYLWMAQTPYYRKEAKAIVAAIDAEFQRRYPAPAKALPGFAAMLFIPRFYQLQLTA